MKTKRLYASILIGTIALGLCIAEQLTVGRTTQELSRQLDNLGALAQQQNTSAAKAQVKTVQAYFAQQQCLLEIFLRRESITAIGANLHGFAAYANDDSLHDLANEAQKTAEQVRMLQRLCIPVFCMGAVV